MPGKLIALVLFHVGLCVAAGAQAAELPPGATVLDPDIVWDVANPHSFAISRDGKQIAYMSKGTLWVCRIDAGPPTKLADLPNTITAILAYPENQEQRKKSAAAPHNIRHQVFYGPKYVNRHYVFSLAWTQDGLVYTVRKRVREDSPVAVNHVMYAPLAGDVSEIAAIEGNFGVPQEYTTSFHVTPDRKFIIASAYFPLIWDVLADRPRATPYDLLLPSSTSGRFLGIEIDTRELVLVDEQFRITKRFAVIFPAERAIDLTWSQDERFAICRTRDDHSTHENNDPYNATAFRIDLETGQQTSLGKCNLHDQFIFFGEGGELLHLRIAGVTVWGYFDGELGTCIAAIDRDGTRRDIFCTRQIRKPLSGQQGTTFPPLIAAPDGSHMAVAVPRPKDQAPGAHYHLVDREGRTEPFAPVSDDSYITPYYPIAFADGGQRLIARSGATLFSVPVSEVAVKSEVSDDE